MQDLELYRLTPLFWFDDSLSNRKNLINGPKPLPQVVVSQDGSTCVGVI